MRLNEVLMQLDELKNNFQKYESIETTEDDVKALCYAINMIKEYSKWIINMNSQYIESEIGVKKSISSTYSDGKIVETITRYTY